MTEGVHVEVQDGFAHIQFLDSQQRGPALAKLLELGGSELIDIDTRSSSRKTYIVLEGMARDAGLLDDARAEPQQEFPEGEPKETWTVVQLRAYARREGVELGDATKKADILAAVTKPKEGVTGGIVPPSEATMS